MPTPRRVPAAAAAVTTAALALAALSGLAACTPSHAAQQKPAAGSTGPTAPVVRSDIPSPSPRPACTAPAGVSRRFSCTMRHRIGDVERYLQGRPGVVGIVLRDRRTGAVWRNANSGAQVYMASTSKLAMATALLMEDRAGRIQLSPDDRSLIHQMLNASSDQAADSLWFKYGASFYTGVFGQIGLQTAQYLPQQGVNGPYWGEITCTPDDLDRVINYVLGRLPGDLRNYIVGELRHVATDQHFGVWGAGPENEPGNKDGWSVEKPGWITDTAGFAGPGARYTLTIMNSLNGQGGYHDGITTLPQVASLLFPGHPGPEPTLQATG
jgi:hypothetical protein